MHQWNIQQVLNEQFEDVFQVRCRSVETRDKIASSPLEPNPAVKRKNAGKLRTTSHFKRLDVIPCLLARVISRYIYYQPKSTAKADFQIIRKHPPMLHSFVSRAPFFSP